MSAHDQMRDMLDQLMGTDRNGETSKYHVQYNDPTVCKSFLLHCCPYDILESTRMDIGKCSKIHNNALRADFNKAQQKFDHFYDVYATEHLQGFIGNCDFRTESARKRLLETQEKLTAEVAEKANAVQELREKIKQMLAKAEELGSQGLVDESVKLMGEIVELRKQISEADDTYKNSMHFSIYRKKKLRVCDVCSAYLSVQDNDQRLADHLGGKLHLGFVKIREKLMELEKNYKERREALCKFYKLERIKREDKRCHMSRVRRERSDRHSRSRSWSRHSRHYSRRRHSRHCSRSRSRSRSHKRNRRDRY